MKHTLHIILLLMIFGHLSFGQILNGTVKDRKGLPVTGALVVIKSLSVAATVDTVGKFSINVGNDFPVDLDFSFVGYKSKQIQVYELPDGPLEVVIDDDALLEEVVVTSRRRNETAQEVPIPISVVSGGQLEESGSFNVNRVKELVPTVQLYSSNPRNTTLNIRGIGSTFGLTNDGIDPGVGFYVDGVYYARPAATTLDFIDIEQIEVLRGPQGTLFGKNTTAGAFNITTRKPSFTPGANFEVSYGNYGYIQAKSSVTGGLIKNKLAGRLSFSGTQRDGTIQNVRTNQYINDLNNQGVRGQLLYTPSEKFKITLAGDYNRQRPNGYAQVVAGVVPTLRAPYRQFDNIIKDLGYDLPSRNPFDRKVDTDTPWRSNSDMGGASLNIDAKIGIGTLTSTTAWRFWNWDPSNDRDFTGLPVLKLSQATSKHQQWTQEIRYAGSFSSRLSGVIGGFLIGQDLKSDPVQIEESGSEQWRFSKSTTSNLWATPGLFDGYGIKTNSRLQSLGAAVFAQVDWEILKDLHVLPGLRYNYDKKDVDYDRQTYGGLQTSDPALIALKNLVYTNQSFNAKVENTNLSGQITVAYKPIKAINTFATYSTNYKPVGINLGGLPTGAGGVPLVELAQIKPEFVNHIEFGIKTSPSSRSTLNLVVYNTDIKDYQTNVQTAEVGVSRGYLANAEKVRVRGIELDGNIRILKNIAINAAGAYSEGKYISFANAPVPLEETGGKSSFKDISGGSLPGISKWTGTLGLDVSSNPINFLGQKGKFFIAFDTYYRSKFSSSPSPSAYLNVNEYALLNGRLGFRSTSGLSINVWARNLLDKNYFEQLLPAAGNAGHYVGVLGDPRTYGITLRYSL